MLEIIDKSILKTCNKCFGKGCSVCRNGIYKDTSYIMIAKQKDGTKIAFQVDQAGK